MKNKIKYNKVIHHPNMDNKNEKLNETVSHTASWLKFRFICSIDERIRASPKECVFCMQWLVHAKGGPRKDNQ